MSPLENIIANIGEHYTNYVLIAADGNHSAKLVYNDYFAAKGLVSIAKKTIDDSLGTGINSFEFDFGLDQEGEH
jgi:hypothetical protein